MSLKRQTLWSMGPLVIVTAVNLVSVPLFYEWLGPEHYALWLYVLTLTGAFGFMDLGLGVAVGRFIGIALGTNDRAAIRAYWGIGNVIGIPLLGLMALLFALGGMTLGPYWFNVSPKDGTLLRNCFIIGGIGLFLNYYGSFWLILSRTFLEFRFVSLLQTATALLQVLPGILIAWLTADPLVLLAWSTIVAGLQLGVLIVHGRKAYGLGMCFFDATLQRLREMSGFIGKTFSSLLINSLFASIDRIVLGRLAPPSAFAHYSICANVGGRIQSLSGAAMGPVFCNTSRAVGAGDAVSVAAIYNEVFQFLFGWYLLICTWSATWHSLVLRLWLGESLSHQVQPLFLPLIIAASVSAISSISGAQLGPLNRLGLGVVFSLVHGFCTAGAVWLGWHVAGTVGVAWGILISRLSVLVQDIVVIRITGGGGWLALATWKQVLVLSLFSACFYTLFNLTTKHLASQLILSVLHATLGAAYLLLIAQKAHCVDKRVRRGITIICRKLGVR
jgi:O-antigen/teichoic acid export membrane protein